MLLLLMMMMVVVVISCDGPQKLTVAHLPSLCIQQNDPPVHFVTAVYHNNFPRMESTRSS